MEAAAAASGHRRRARRPAFEAHPRSGACSRSRACSRDGAARDTTCSRVRNLLPHRLEPPESRGEGGGIARRRSRTRSCAPSSPETVVLPIRHTLPLLSPSSPSSSQPAGNPGSGQANIYRPPQKPPPRSSPSSCRWTIGTYEERVNLRGVGATARSSMPRSNEVSATSAAPRWSRRRHRAVRKRGRTEAAAGAGGGDVSWGRRQRAGVRVHTKAKKTGARQAALMRAKVAHPIHRGSGL